MTPREQQIVAAGIVRTIKRALEPLKSQLAASEAAKAELETRVKHLEARPLQKWAGTHVEGTRYVEASLVTRQGSLWVATRGTTTTPGEAGGDWRLIVKRGQV